MVYKELNKFKFSFIPLGDENLASSRLRCYKLREGLERAGFNSIIGFDTSCDILIIQKNTGDIAIDAAFACKRKSRVLIFDIDDFFDCPEFLYKAQLLVSLADVVTTATPEQGILAGELFHGLSKDRIFCLPNPIDYNLLEPINKFHEMSQSLKIVWFGNIENFPNYILSRESIPRSFEFHAITNASACDVDRYPHCHFHEWSYNSFSDMLSKFDVCLLSHQGSEILNAKSANKMVTAIVHGLPVVASSTPDYQRVAHLAGLDDWIYDDELTLNLCLEKLKDPIERNAYISKAQQVVNSKFHIDKITMNFLDIVLEARKMAVHHELRAILMYIRYAYPIELATKKYFRLKKSSLCKRYAQIERVWNGHTVQMRVLG
jgi:hypothetical protein